MHFFSFLDVPEQFLYSVFPIILAEYLFNPLKCIAALKTVVNQQNIGFYLVKATFWKLNNSIHCYLKVKSYPQIASAKSYFRLCFIKKFKKV